VTIVFNVNQSVDVSSCFILFICFFFSFFLNASIIGTALGVGEEQQQQQLMANTSTVSSTSTDNINN